MAKPSPERSGRVSLSLISVTNCPIGWNTGHRIKMFLVKRKTTANRMPMKNRKISSLSGIA